MPQFAVVYRDKESQMLVREFGLSYEEALKRSEKVSGDIHKMNGVKSFCVKRYFTR